MKPSVSEVLPEANGIYKRSPVGCCLHIVLDDGNIKDSDVQFCVDQAKENSHTDCLSLAEKLLIMSKTQRKKLAARISIY